VGVTNEQNPPVDDTDDLPEQMQVRHEKRNQILASGGQAYPVRVPITTTIIAIRLKYPDLAPEAATGDFVGIAGRVMFLRNTGKLCFATVREGDGTEIQAMFSLDKVGEEVLNLWKSEVDLGDLVSVTGEVITSKRGELSILASSWKMAAKSLRPLPVEHKPLSEETRVRMRYVDLIVRPEARTNARLRPNVMRALRETFHSKGFIEVENPKTLNLRQTKTIKDHLKLVFKKETPKRNNYNSGGSLKVC
jgi:lysyl-tRNA synthetase class 2